MLSRLRSKIRNQRGVALFMILTAMTLLSVVAAELAYVSQVNQRMAYDSLDQAKALYLAKSGFKISLLRLSIYRNLSALDPTGAMKIPQEILNKIWDFPFIFPLPSEIPGIDPAAKEKIQKFQKESALDGSFTAVIESESTKLNLNMALAGFAAEAPKTGTSTNTQTDTTITTDTSTGTSTGTSTAFDPKAAKDGLQGFINQIVTDKEKAEPEFKEENRDFNIDELMDGIYAWSDPHHDRKTNSGRELIRPKKAPFYSSTELRMVYPMDDKIYDLLSPHLTAMPTPGINVNIMKDPVLKALVPGITDDEIKVFHEQRDDPEKGKPFDKVETFYTFLKEKIPTVGGQTGVDELKKRLEKQRTYITVDETVFKLTVQAQVNQSIKVIEALVKLDKISKNPAPPAPGQSNTGLKIIFMRIL